MNDSELRKVLMQLGPCPPTDQVRVGDTAIWLTSFDLYELLSELQQLRVMQTQVLRKAQFEQ